MTAQEVLDRYMELAYRVVLRKDETTEGAPCIVAEHPELPGCMAHGDTVAEAFGNLNDARRAYIESLLEDEQPVPLPKLGETSVTEGWEIVEVNLSFGDPEVREPYEIVVSGA